VTDADVAIDRHGDVVLARLRGEVDMANADALGERLLAELSNVERAAVIDASEVMYVDSAGIRLLFELAGDLNARRQSLAIVVRPESAVAQILDVTSFHRVAAVATSVDEALSAVARDGG
jgi:stage II sporulation protein AA (anti-sigma F factor antagonist)